GLVDRSTSIRRVLDEFPATRDLAAPDPHPTASGVTMDLICPYCGGTGTAPGRPEHCSPCQGHGRIHLDRRQRQEAVVQLLENRSSITTPAERLAFRVVAKAVMDLDTPNDASAEVLAGALDPWLGILGISPGFLYRALEDANLLFTQGQPNMATKIPNETQNPREGGPPSGPYPNRPYQKSWA
ncbi:MAG: hypothetical protein ABEK42_13835, partial [Thiohalorhabdaceae bacterium]